MAILGSQAFRLEPSVDEPDTTLLRLCSQFVL